jgi:hypothetical protein
LGEPIVRAGTAYSLAHAVGFQATRCCSRWLPTSLPSACARVDPHYLLSRNRWSSQVRFAGRRRPIGSMSPSVGMISHGWLASGESERAASHGTQPILAVFLSPLIPCDEGLCTYERTYVRYVRIQLVVPVFAVCSRRRPLRLRSLQSTPFSVCAVFAVDAVVSLRSRRHCQSSQSAVAVVSLRSLQSTPLSHSLQSPSLTVFAVCSRRRCQSSQSAVAAVVTQSAVAVIVSLRSLQSPSFSRSLQSTPLSVFAVAVIVSVRAVIVSLRSRQSTPLAVFAVCAVDAVVSLRSQQSSSLSRSLQSTPSSVFAVCAVDGVPVFAVCRCRKSTQARCRAHTHQWYVCVCVCARVYVRGVVWCAVCVCFAHHH